MPILPRAFFPPAIYAGGFLFMLKKIKRYLLLIPLLFVMLLNVSVYGQILSSSAAIDYNSYFKPVSECPHPFDFSDSDYIISEFQTDPYYFYSVYMSVSDYDNYISGSSYKVYFDFWNFTSAIPEYESSSIVHFYGDRSYCHFTYDSSSDTYSNFVLSSHVYDKNFVYYKNTGSWLFTSNINFSISDYDNEDYCDELYYYFQYTNIPDFPLFYDYEASQSSLNVDVVFSPELTGVFNRTVSDRGQKVTLDEFSFKVSNNSNFDIQYLMAIYRESDTFLPFNTDPLVAKYDTNFNGKTYNGSPVYVYVKDEWLYLPHRQNGVITGYAPSSWHMVSSGDSDFVTINFNQVKLNTYQNYTVVVYAIRNDLAYVTPFTNLNEFQVPACSDFNVDIDNLTLVYSSQFSILNPAEFDASNNDNSYAFDVDDRLLFNRANGYIDENGEMVIDRVDTNQWVTEGSDDPWVNLDSDLNAWDTYYKNQNTVSSDIDQLSRNFSSFFKFVNKFFSYFPKNYQSITLLGLTSLVVLGIIKVVI